MSPSERVLCDGVRLIPRVNVDLFITESNSVRSTTHEKYDTSFPLKTTPVCAAPESASARRRGGLLRRRHRCSFRLEVPKESRPRRLEEAAHLLAGRGAPGACALLSLPSVVARARVSARASDESPLGAGAAASVTRLAGAGAAEMVPGVATSCRRAAAPLGRTSHGSPPRPTARPTTAAPAPRRSAWARRPRPSASQRARCVVASCEYGGRRLAMAQHRAEAPASLPGPERSCRSTSGSEARRARHRHRLRSRPPPCATR